jgi:hypothetical protein
LEEGELTELIDFSAKLNTELFDIYSHCKVLKTWPTKNNNKNFQAIVVIDRSTYERHCSSVDLCQKRERICSVALLRRRSPRFGGDVLAGDFTNR